MIDLEFISQSFTFGLPKIAGAIWSRLVLEKYVWAFHEFQKLLFI